MSQRTPDETWDEIFGDFYLRAYQDVRDRDSEREALGAAALAGVEPPAEVLDAPTGFGRHAIPLAEHGFRVTGIDRSPVQLEEARRMGGDVEWPKWVTADFRELPFAVDSFDAAFCLFSSIGYRGEDADRDAFREYVRVLRPGAVLLIETMHRDLLMAIFQERSWDPLVDDAIRLEERRFDHAAGEIETTLSIVEVGERRSITYRMRTYTATDLVRLLADVGFGEIDCFGDLEGGPLSRATRLVVRARKPTP